LGTIKPLFIRVSVG